MKYDSNDGGVHSITGDDIDKDDSNDGRNEPRSSSPHDEVREESSIVEIDNDDSLADDGDARSYETSNDDTTTAAVSQPGSQEDGVKEESVDNGPMISNSDKMTDAHELGNTRVEIPPLSSVNRNFSGNDNSNKNKNDDDDEEESTFGPFVDPVINLEWNPFEEEDTSEGRTTSALFSIDDDDDDDEVDDVDKQTKRRGKSNNNMSSTTQSIEEEQLENLRKVLDSEYDRALEDQEISWRARYGATRLSFAVSLLLMFLYLWLGCMFYRSEANWTIPEALLFTIYTVTTVGYGGPMELPNTASFHAFTSIYVLAGISLVTVLAAHTWQVIQLEATRIRSSPWSGGGASRRRSSVQQQRDDEQQQQQESSEGGIVMGEVDRYRSQFMNELEDLVGHRPILEATLAKIKECRIYLRSTKTGRFLAVAFPFAGMILLGAIVVGTIEEWTPLASIYWSIVTLTTVGYGDMTPTKRSSMWFCILFFIPSSLFFLSFLLAHVAKSYIRLHAIHVTRLERWTRLDNERRREKTKRSKIAKRNADASVTDSSPCSDRSSEKTLSPDMETGFKTVFSYNEDEESTKSSGLFGDQAGAVEDTNDLSMNRSPALRYRQNVIRTRESNRRVTFAEAHLLLCQHPLQSLSSSTVDPSKPSLDVRMRVQSRLARIIADDVAGFQSSVVIKGFNVNLTIGSLRDTAEKWKIPVKAWKAFRATAFRSLLYVGERELISDGGEALLRLNVGEFHQIFSPLLAAFGDGNIMEAWLIATDVLADVELRGGSKYGQVKPVFNGTLT